MNRKAALLIIAVCLMGSMQSRAAIYTVSIDTTTLQGDRGTLAFDFTSSDPFSNFVFILDFTHNGATGPPETQGGLVSGDIILSLNPAPVTSIGDEFFFNQLAVPFTSFGTSITFTVLTTDVAPAAGGLPDELSLFILTPDRKIFIGSADPNGADAMFSLCIDGTLSGLLNVFDPAEFVKPDMITINGPLVGKILFKDSFETSVE